MTHTYTHLSAHTCIQAGDREGSERGERGECETPRRRDRHTALRKGVYPPILSWGLFGVSHQKRREIPDSFGGTGEKKRAQPEWAHSLPPTSTLPGTSGTSGHPDPRAYRTSAPPRTQPTCAASSPAAAARAHSAGATGRTAARREEPCGCGPGGRRARLDSAGPQGAIEEADRPPPPPPPPTPPQPPAAQSGPLARACLDRCPRRRALPAGERSDRRASVPSANCRPGSVRQRLDAPGRREPGEGLRARPGAHTGEAGPGAGQAGAQSARGREHRARIGATRSQRLGLWRPGSLSPQPLWLPR